MKNERMILFLLAAVQFTNIMDFMIMMPLGENLMRLWSISPQQFSVIVSSYSILAGISGFAGAFYLDKLDRKKALIYFYAGFTLGTLACALSPSYMILIIARGLTGIFGGTIAAISISIVSDIIPVERRASAMGIVMASFSLAAIAGVPFGLYLANTFSWHAPFLFLAVISFGILLFINSTIPAVRSHIDNGLVKENPMRIFINIVKEPNQQMALLFMILLIFGQFLVIPFITPYMIRNVGMDAKQVPWIYAVGGALTFFSSPIIGKIADNIGRKKTFYIMAALSVIPLIITTNLPVTPLYYILPLMGLFFILISGRMIPSQALMTSLVKPENRGSFMSLNSCVQQLGAGFASLASGSIIITRADGVLEHYQYAGYIGVGATFIAMFLATRIKLLEGK